MTTHTDLRQHPVETLAFPGKVLWYSYAAIFYRNGGVASFVLNPLHPLAWVCAPLFFLGSVLLSGLPETWKYRENIGFRVAPYFKKHGKKIEWFLPHHKYETKRRKG